MKSINATIAPTPVPLGTAKQAKDGYKIWENKRKKQTGWRFMSPFRNRARMEAERKKHEGTK